MTLKKRIEKAVDHADGAFWSEIVMHFPEVNSGDFPPEAHIKLKNACIEAVTLWVNINK